MSNKANGNSFEQELCNRLAAAGFWAHNMANRANGQPADVIASIKGVPILIDCKVCENDVFSFSRIEDNQYSAMMKWMKCGNAYCGFAIKTSRAIFMVSFTSIIEYMRNGRKSMDPIGMAIEDEDFMEMYAARVGGDYLTEALCDED